MKNVLGLDLGAHNIKAVELRQTFRGLEPVQMRVHPRALPDAPLPELLRRFVNMHQLPTDHIIAALPGEKLSVRHMEFPFRDTKRLTAAVPFEVEGENVFKVLQYESGGHRVQRIPVTESSGRIHTSAATVAVFPEAEAEDDISIPADEVRVDIYRSSGPGGQSVNTTDSAVRLTHVPTGIVVQCQDEKSQHRNREKAMVVLTSRILAKRRQDEADAMGAKRRALIGSGDRSERVRTYNFPQNRLTDHRINMTLYSLDRVMEGGLDELSHALREHDLQDRLDHELRALASDSSEE